MRPGARETEANENLSFDLSIGDLMAALLLIFILLLASNLLNLKKEYEQKSDVAERYNQLQVALYMDLYREFKDDLPKWGAVLDQKTLSVRFKEPDVLFEPDSSILKPAFKGILADFFPRYLKVLMQPKYRDNIEELRIEGHTAKSDLHSYMDHIDVSQARTDAVLRYVISLPPVADKPDVLEWTESKVTANGLAYSHPVLNADGTPNWDLSRRVEFRVRTNAEQQIRELLNIGSEYQGQK